MTRGSPNRGALLASMMAILLAWIADAAAHTSGTTGFARITVHGQTVRYSLTLSGETLAALPGLAAAARPGAIQDPGALADLVARKIAIAADGRACAPTPGTVQPPTADRSTAVVIVDYACAAPVRELSVRDDLFDALGGDYHTLAHFERSAADAGRGEQFVFEPDRRATTVRMSPTDAQPTPARSGLGAMYSYIRLGLEHILLGYDHILFVVALMLRGGRFLPLLAIVTAFTVAHSITLSLAVLDLMTLPARLVEPVIALSIAYVALENMVMRRQPSRRWAVSFVFGLVHGFGFAGALTELDLPRQGLVSALLGFNIGVEIGQAMVVAVLLPPLLWAQRFTWRSRAVTATSAILLVAGLALLVERTLLTTS